MGIIVDATPLIYLTKIRLMDKVIENYDIMTTQEILNEVTAESEKYEDAMRLKEMGHRFSLPDVDYRGFNTLDIEAADKSLLGLVSQNIHNIRKGKVLVVVDDSVLRKFIKIMLRSWKAKKRLYFTPEFIYRVHKDGLIHKSHLITLLGQMKETTYLRRKVISNMLEVLK
jgi:hypothetical protein